MNAVAMKKKFVEYISDKDELSDEVAQTVNEFVTASENADISQKEKFDLLDRAAYEVDRIDCFAVNFKFGIIAKQLKYATKDEQIWLMITAKTVDFQSSRTDDFLIGKILHDIYTKLDAENKKIFNDTYKKKYDYKIKAYERTLKENELKNAEKRLAEIDNLLKNDTIAAKQKLKLIDDALDILKDTGLFGRKQANLRKASYCKKATEFVPYIYPEPEPHDYKGMAEKFRRIADLADLYGKQGNSPSARKSYMKKYGR